MKATGMGDMAGKTSLETWEVSTTIISEGKYNKSFELCANRCSVAVYVKSVLKIIGLSNEKSF